MYDIRLCFFVLPAVDDFPKIFASVVEDNDCRSEVAKSPEVGVDWRNLPGCFTTLSCLQQTAPRVEYEYRAPLRFLECFSDELRQRLVAGPRGDCIAESVPDFEVLVAGKVQPQIAVEPFQHIGRIFVVQIQDPPLLGDGPQNPEKVGTLK